MSLKTLAKLAGALAVCLTMAAAAPAQYGGGTMGGGTGGTGTGTPNYSGGNYGSGKAIGIGVGAAAGAAVGIALLVHHYHHKAKSQALLIGCTEPAASGMSVTSEQDGQTYILAANGQNVKAGERVELKGMLKSDPSGTSIFRVRNVVSDFGACRAATASTARPKQLGGS